MSLATTISHITSAELSYAPAVLAGVQAAELSGQTGTNKAQAVVDGVIAMSGALVNAPQPTVGGLFALVNLTVSILNALGVFRKKTPPV